jgi:hypothetical protein
MGRTAEQGVGAGHDNDSATLVLGRLLELLEETVDDLLGQRIPLLRPIDGKDTDMLAGAAANYELVGHDPGW